MGVESLHFIRTLQLVDSFFPVGAFAYSDGLETAVAGARVRDAVSLGEWMEHFLENVFAPCEGLALVKCMLALEAGDLDALRRNAIAVRGCRNLRKTDLKLNDATPRIEVNPETYEVRADGKLLQCDPAETLPLAQRYFLF